MMIIKHSSKVIFILDNQSLNLFLIDTNSTTSVLALKALSHVSDQWMEVPSLSTDTLNMRSLGWVQLSPSRLSIRPRKSNKNLLIKTLALTRNLFCNQTFPSLISSTWQLQLQSTCLTPLWSVWTLTLIRWVTCWTRAVKTAVSYPQSGCLGLEQPSSLIITLWQGLTSSALSTAHLTDSTQ